MIKSKIVRFEAMHLPPMFLAVLHASSTDCLTTQEKGN